MEEKQFQCKFCPVKLSSEQKWKRHINLQHNANVCKCELCPMVFYSKNEFKHHFNEKHKPTCYRHTCQYCGVSYKWFKFLQMHIQKFHTIDKMSQCAKCGEEFYNSIVYQKHLKLKHSPGRKLYKCDNCFKSFTAKALLHLHQKFDHSANGLIDFRVYVKENLNLTDDLLASKKKCIKCDLKFSSALYLFKHFKFTHNPIKYYKCCKCEQAIYNSRSGLGIHMHFEHNLPRGHSCSKCSIGYTKPPKSARNIPNPIEDVEDVSSDQPPWARLYIKSPLPKDVNLKNATDEEVNNLRHNTTTVFHILSTIPPSKLKGKLEGDRTESLFSINTLRGSPYLRLKRTYDRDLTQKIKEIKNKSHKNLLINEKNKVNSKITKNNKVKFQCEQCPQSFPLRIALNVHVKKNHMPTNASYESNVTIDSEHFSKSSSPETKTTFGHLTDEDVLIHTTVDSTDTLLPAEVNQKSANVISDIYIQNTTSKFTKSQIDDAKLILDFHNSVTELSYQGNGSKLTESHDSVNLLRSSHDERSKTISDSKSLQLYQLKSRGLKFRKCRLKYSNNQKLQYRSCVPITKKKTENKTKEGKERRSASSPTDYLMVEKQISKDILLGKKRRYTKRLHKCLKCENKFTKRGLLLSHIRNDHKIDFFKLFKCEKCFAVFKGENKLQQHITFKHKSLTPVNGIPLIKINKDKMTPITIDKLLILPITDTFLFRSNAAMYDCKICLSYFPSNELLQRHIQWEHNTNINLYKCGQCSEVMYSANDLELHLHNLHNIDIISEISN